MNDAFYAATTALSANQLQLDTVANNLANASTPAFKKARVSFQDLVYQELGRAAEPGRAAGPALGQSMGAGVVATLAGQVFTPGELRKTDSALDVAVRGTGFIEVLLEDGSTAYARGGSLQVNKDGLLTDAQGHVLKASVNLGASAKDLAIAADGRVTAKLNGAATSTDLGQIDLVDFSHPGGLRSLGNGLYQATDRSGDPITLRAGLEGVGTLAQGYLENSNVNLIDELMSLMMAQRSYGISAKIVQAADEVMGLVNGLRR